MGGAGWLTWGVFALLLTALGLAGTWLAFRRRGARTGLRWLSATLLVPAAYFTGTLRMFSRIGDAVADWALSFTWNPFVWVGLGLALLAVGCFLVSRRLPARGGRPSRRERRATAAAGQVSGQEAGAVGAAPRGAQRGAPAIDDDLAEIEALLKRRGIS